MASTATPHSARLLALGLAAVLMMAGAGIGVSVDRLWVRPASTRAPDHHKNQPHTSTAILAHMQRRLQLTDAQVTQLTPVVTALLDEVHGIRGRSKKQAIAAHDRAQNKILAILDTQQATVYHRWMQSKFSKHHKGRGGHHRGHTLEPHAPNRHNPHPKDHRK